MERKVKILMVCHGNIRVFAWNACEINTLRNWQGEFDPVLPLIIIGLPDDGGYENNFIEII